MTDAGLIAMSDSDPSWETSMASLELRDVQINHTIEGNTNDPVLVLSNSLGTNRSLWNLQTPAFVEHFRVLRYDARGHGESSTPEGPYSIEEMGSDVLGLLDHLQIAQASFCGISIGGLVGQWLALNAPERLHRLVLCNTSAKIGSAEAWNTRIAVVNQDGLESVIKGTLERWFTPDFTLQHPEVVEHAKIMLQAMKVKGYAASCAAVRDADFRAAIPRIEIPSLVIAGIHDPVIDISEGVSLAQQIPGSSYLAIPAAHLSNLEAVEQFNAAVLTFLRAEL
jgi:3-oxoadipate enol-lactonase